MNMTNPELSAVLNDIRDFKLGLIRGMTKADIDQIGRYGFEYKTSTLAGRREEIRDYMLNHPSLMAGSMETIKKNFKIMGVLINIHSSPQASEGYDEYTCSESYSDSEPQPKPKPKRELQFGTHKATQASSSPMIQTLVESSSDSDNYSVHSTHSKRSACSKHSTHSHHSSHSHRSSHSKHSHKVSKARPIIQYSDEEFF